LFSVEINELKKKISGKIPWHTMVANDIVLKKNLEEVN